MEHDPVLLNFAGLGSAGQFAIKFCTKACRILLKIGGIRLSRIKNSRKDSTDGPWVSQQKYRVRNDGSRAKD